MLDREALSALARLSGLGISLALGVAFFAWLGWWLDRWLGTEPWLLALCTLLGGALSLYKLVRDAQRASGEADSE